ncbi:MAG: HAD-IIB family hydrolase [Ruminococcus sp.]|nr:HAD-IIB family hydrolase [Ruminococcus sp.]
MKKTLYISDLDGTLLDSNAEVSEYTVGRLNEFIGKGGYFSIATARTAATAMIITKDININVPVVLMNGVCVFDTVKNEYVKKEEISDDIFLNLVDVLSRFKLSGFMFTLNGNELDTYYENTDSPNARKFVEERERKFGKVFKKTSSFYECREKNVIYYSVTDKFDVLSPVYDALKQVEGLHLDFYRDVYATDYWYLEISSCKASKYNAVMFIREKYGFDEVVGFGDNLNDIPLFNACDRAYAVANAKEEVKEASDGIILSNLEDGVAKKICSECF